MQFDEVEAVDQLPAAMLQELNDMNESSNGESAERDDRIQEIVEAHQARAQRNAGSSTTQARGEGSALGQKAAATAATAEEVGKNNGEGSDRSRDGGTKRKRASRKYTLGARGKQKGTSMRHASQGHRKPENLTSSSPALRTRSKAQSPAQQTRSKTNSSVSQTGSETRSPVQQAKSKTKAGECSCSCDTSRLRP